MGEKAGNQVPRGPEGDPKRGAPASLPSNAGRVKDPYDLYYTLAAAAGLYRDLTKRLAKLEELRDRLGKVAESVRRT